MAGFLNRFMKKKWYLFLVIIVCIIVIASATFFVFKWNFGQISSINLENYIYEKTKIENVSFKSLNQKTVKLVTFSDSNSTFRFLTLDSCFEGSCMKDEWAVSVKVDVPDTVASLEGWGAGGTDLWDAFRTKECGDERDIKDVEKSESCIRAAIITEASGEISTECISNGRESEECTKDGDEFSNRMMKMNFKIEKINVEEYIFDVPNKGGLGCHPYEIWVYAWNGKPIGYFTQILCRD